MQHSFRLRLFPIIGVVLAGALNPLSAANPKTEHGFPGLKLPQRFTKGPAIPLALGNRAAEVAQAYEHTEIELRDICTKDRNAITADSDARLFYVCSALPPATQSAPNGTLITQPSYPVSQTFFLSSNLNASKTIYLDFTGHTTSNTVWNNSITNGADIVTPPYDIDGNPSSFSDAELANIQNIWKRVAEDYAPFNVNVTTREPDVEDLRKTAPEDIFYGIRVVIGGNSTWFGSSVGGIAYLKSFSWSSDSPAFVFPAQLGNGNPKYVGEAVAHEAGHSFGLNHDGKSGVEYFEGQGTWAPIMGVGYYRDISQWSKGEYSGANNLQDDTAIIAQEVSGRTDAYGNTLDTATVLTGTTPTAEGVIETRTDVDYFKINVGAGSSTFTVTPDNVSPNLDLQLRLFNGAGTLVTTANPAGMSATITATLAQGTYYLEVDGVGYGTATTTGYSDYASLGQYRLTGTVKAPVGQPPVAVANQSTPLTGVAPLIVTFSSAGSFDPDGLIKTYAWKFGDGTSGTGTKVAHTYTKPGTYNATLTVTDNSGLSSVATVTIVVVGPPAIFVKSIDMALNDAAYGKRFATATVTITDKDGKPVPNATVTGAWTGLVKASASGKTDSAGVVRFSTTATSSRGIFAFTVTSVTATGYAYNAAMNVETMDSIATP